MEPKSNCCILAGYTKIDRACHPYDPSTHKVNERRDVVFDEVITHGPLRSFPLLFIDNLQMISVDLSPRHFDDDSYPMCVSSSTLSTVIG